MREETSVQEAGKALPDDAQDLEQRVAKAAELEVSGRLRQPAGAASWVIGAIGVAMALFHLWAGGVQPFDAIVQRSTHLTFALVLGFLLVPAARGLSRRRVPLYDVALALLAVAAGVYIMYIYAGELTLRLGVPNQTDRIMGVVMLLLVLEACRRIVGWPLPILAGLALLYAAFGPYIPLTFLAHRGYDLDRIVGSLYLGLEGIYGVPLGASAEFVALFVIFGAVLQASGAGAFFSDLAYATMGRVRGGAAKVSVVSSSLFGTISGSAVANVVVDGAFTIPLMRRTGYQPHVAAAIEATASTGGQVMPPVMGAAAFIMAQVLNMPYIEVAAAAAIPAILYYVALFAMVDLEAAKHGIRGLPAAELPPIKATLRAGWHLLVPVFILIYLLVVVDWSAPKTAVLATIGAIVISAVRRHTRMKVQQVVAALRDGAYGTLDVAVTCATAGIVIGVVLLTGLGTKLSLGLITLAGGNLLLLLFLTMIASLILGMGLPTTACYIILSVLVAPTLVKMGVVPISAHLFVFYFGIISAITPPVALAAYAAAGIGRTDPIRTGISATRLGFAGFLVPYLFVYNPVLLLIGELWEIALATLSGALGVVLLAAAIQGYLFDRLSTASRLVLGTSALLLAIPSVLPTLLGFALLVVYAAYYRWARQRARAQVSVPH